MVIKEGEMVEEKNDKDRFIIITRVRGWDFLMNSKMLFLFI